MKAICVLSLVVLAVATTGCSGDSDENQYDFNGRWRVAITGITANPCGLAPFSGEMQVVQRGTSISITTDPYGSWGSGHGDGTCDPYGGFTAVVDGDSSFLTYWKGQAVDERVLHGTMELPCDLGPTKAFWTASLVSR